MYIGPDDVLLGKKIRKYIGDRVKRPPKTHEEKLSSSILVLLPKDMKGEPSKQKAKAVYKFIMLFKQGSFDFDPSSITDEHIRQNKEEEFKNQVEEFLDSKE